MPIQRLIVVADAHLGAVPASVEEALLHLLDELPKLGDGLLLNGDLFAFWFSYRRAIPRSEYFGRPPIRARSVYGRTTVR